MGSRIRIGVRISPSEMLWTGAHYGAEVDETAPILVKHYSTPAQAIRLASLPYAHGGIHSYDEMVARQAEWSVRVMEEAKLNGKDVYANVRERAFEDPATIISPLEWASEEHTPTDVETVYLYQRDDEKPWGGEWVYAEIRGRVRQQVAFRPVVERLADDSA